MSDDPAAPGSTPVEPAIQDTIPVWVRELLRCPIGGQPLVEARDDQGRPVLECVVDTGSPPSRRRYPIDNGIPVLLASEARTITE